MGHASEFQMAEFRGSADVKTHVPVLLHHRIDPFPVLAWAIVALVLGGLVHF